MNRTLVTFQSLPDFSLWQKMAAKRRPLSFEMELTARCNNNCRHCYINLPAADQAAQKKELTLEEIGAIADQAKALGALWCVLTGGEPFLRADFADIYRLLKKKGLLVSVLTNACLVTEKQVKLFRQLPPRDMEVTVYGASRQTYETVTRQSGSFAAFRRGLDLLLKGGVAVRLKAMVLRSNLPELPAIARFCRERTKDYFRFDPFLHLRYDRDPRRNKEISAERLSPAAIAVVEQTDKDRAAALKKECRLLAGPPSVHNQENHFLFQCGAATGSFVVGWDGCLRLCQSLCHPDCIYNLRRGSLADAWLRFIPQVLARRSHSKVFLKRCYRCSLIDLCMWCPAHAFLEHGRLDGWCRYFCEVAHARVKSSGGKSAYARKTMLGE